jgi:hypothetical protein
LKGKQKPPCGSEERKEKKKRVWSVSHRPSTKKWMAERGEGRKGERGEKRRERIRGNMK